MESNINLDKLNNYAEKVADRLCRQFFDDNRLINGQEILKFTEIEQLNLLILKNLFLKWNEESHALKSPYFDYESEDVKRAMNDFLNVLSKNISIGKEAFHPILTQSVEELVILVSDFKAYMQHFVVDKNVSADLIEKSAKFYKIHSRPFRLSSSMLVKSRHPDADSIPTSFLPDENDQQEAYNQVIPVLEQISAIDPHIFLKDSSSAQGANETERSMADTDRTPISRPQKPIIPKEEQRNIDTHPTHTNEAAAHHDSNASASDESEIASQQNTENERPLAKDIVTENHETKIEQPNIADEQRNAESVSSDKEKSVLNDRFSEPKESLAEKHRSLKGESLRSAISLNQKFMFINQLFNGNTQELEHAIGMIENSNGFQEALEKVKSAYADSYGWDFEKDEETEFLEMISRRFK